MAIVKGRKSGVDADVPISDEIYELPDVQVIGTRFDPNDLDDIDLSQNTIDYILQSGDTRTQYGKFAQHLLDQTGAVSGWTIAENDKTNAMINVWESAFNRVFGTDYDLPNVPNVAEMVGDVLRKFVVDENGDPVELPAAVQVNYQLKNDNLGKDFVSNLGAWLTTDAALESINKGVPYIIPGEMPDDEESSNPITNFLRNNVTEPIQGLGVAIQKAVGGKAPEMLLNQIGFAQGVPFAGNIINSLADIMAPKTKEGWLKYLKNNGYIDSRGNQLKDFDPTNWKGVRNALDDLFRVPPKDDQGNRDYSISLETENQMAEAIRGVLVSDAGVDPNTIKDMSISTLTELSGYISDFLTEDQITSTPAVQANKSEYDNYYNDGTQSNTDFSSELNQIETWVKDQTVDPAQWFSNLGIKPEDSVAFGQQAGERVSGFLSNHYNDVANGDAEWNSIGFYGNNANKNWYSYHRDNTNEYVKPVFNELAQNHIISETGLFPNSSDNITGQNSLFASFNDGSGGNRYEIIGGYQTDEYGDASNWANDGNWQGYYSSNFYSDDTGDGYADGTSSMGSSPGFNLGVLPSSRTQGSAVLQAIGVIDTNDFGYISNAEGRTVDSINTA